MTAPDEDVCGETFDHDLRVLSERDGITVYECRRCGAEVFSEVVAPTAEDHPCACSGCWACAGYVPGCTCDVDWDALAEKRLDG